MFLVVSTLVPLPRWVVLDDNILCPWWSLSRGSVPLSSSPLQYRREGRQENRGWVRRVAGLGWPSVSRSLGSSVSESLVGGPHVSFCLILEEVGPKRENKEGCVRMTYRKSRSLSREVGKRRTTKKILIKRGHTRLEWVEVGGKQSNSDFRSSFRKYRGV